ncbi:dUTP diphosphatase [Anaerosalibacter massiliensis]|uniref:dUTP diphosphatase n=1 Tax=Anaerosalibacter massiliensis TaxID=1347392 RepID=UPI0005B26F4B|nr:dUTP diphosphatase [Anaerosalibacter massiliensis]
MKLNKLYKLQEELDKTILENEVKRTGKEIDKDLLLKQTILALQVEVAELANATRCFKHWSTKEAESKERLLDEYADILHFYLSIGNQLGVNEEKLTVAFNMRVNDKAVANIFIELMGTINELHQGIEYSSVSNTVYRGYRYSKVLNDIETLGVILGFTEEEIEQAYMKKHEVNYRRQEEGY